NLLREHRPHHPPRRTAHALAGDARNRRGRAGHRGAGELAEHSPRAGHRAGHCVSVIDAIAHMQTRIAMLATMFKRPTRAPMREPAPAPKDWDVANGAAVRCRGVTKRFGAAESGTWALRGGGLEVPPGQMTLLVGPSGCGKTTLISVVAGLLDPTEGEVEVLGAEFAKLSGRQLVQFRGANIGFVFQQYNLLPALTAVENAAVPLTIAG